MRILAVLVLVLSAVPSRAGEDVGGSFKHLTTVTKSMRLRSATASFVPEGCTVQSWCLVKATDCFLGFTANPGGLWQGHAQYSVVRRATAYCPVGYGKWETRTFMSGVEPQPFTSEILTDKDEAGAAALKLCKAYRADWLSAAPACGN